MEITQSSILTLNGLDKHTQLEELSLNYCTKLEELCCLEESKETLVSLLLDHCKSVRNHEYVKRLDHLDVLAYNNGGTISSIQFIKDMPLLKSFRFVGTDIIDGDVTPCIGLIDYYLQILFT